MKNGPKKNFKIISQDQKCPKMVFGRASNYTICLFCSISSLLPIFIYRTQFKKLFSVLTSGDIIFQSSESFPIVKLR